MYFGAFSLVSESAKFPLKYYANNVAATLKLIDVMVGNDVKRFVFSSTASVYGEPEQIPIAESHDCHPPSRQPLWCRQIVG